MSLTVTKIELPSDKIEVLRTFQEALRAIVNIYHSGGSSDKRGQINSLKEYMSLRDSLRRFHNYPFMVPVLKQFSQIEKELQQHMEAAKEVNNFSDKLDGMLGDVISAWKSGNTSTIISATKPLTNFVKNYRTSKTNVLRGKFNPFYIENPLIFQTNDFLKVFEKSEIETVLNTNLDTHKFSYIPMNDLAETDFQYMAYIILNLSNEPVTVTLTGKDLARYFEISFGGEDYKTLINLVQDYLSTNEKSAIPKIIDLIHKFPKIREANDNAKETITKVYRGYPKSDGDKSTMQQSDFIATSKYMSVAKRFALQIGHLEDSSSRRSDTGIIDTYDIVASDVLIDMTIFGGIFGEGEVIIRNNPKKIVDTDYV